MLASEKKRILHIRDSSGIFGGERVILTLGRNIDRALFDFTLMCMRRGDGRSDALIAGARRAGIPVEGVEVRGRLDAGALSRLREFIAASGVDLIHTHDFKLSLIHISEPTRLLSISYAVFCLKKKN